MRALSLLLIAWGGLATGATADAPGQPPTVLRCGWFENPTPGNAWLTDRDGQWLIGVQGGHQAEGDWPRFTSARWVRTNGHYGYGCACLKVVADEVSHEVQRIVSAGSRTLRTCRRDKTLVEPRFD